MRRYLFSFLLAMTMLHGFAQVIVKNSGTSKLYVAYCTGNIIAGWSSHGWVQVEAGEEKTLFNVTILAYPTFYYCATIEHCDQGYYGTARFPIDPRNAFTIAHADKAQTYSNPDIRTVGFREVNLGTQKTYTIELKPTNLICNQQPQGKWRIGIDKEGDYAEKPEDAFYYREITFDNGRPVGWCKDYYPNGTLRAEFKLAQYKPAIYDGHCTWYNPDGTKEKEVTYQNGIAQSDHTVYEAVALPVQNFFVNSQTKLNGHSTVPYAFNLPPNTVKWFYEFTASRDAAEVQNLSSRFSAAAKLAGIADKTGLLSYSINLLTAPPGADYCNIYITDQQYLNNQPNLETIPRSTTASRINYKSGITEVNEPTLKNPVILLNNPSGLYGINVSVQVVAIVAKSE